MFSSLAWIEMPASFFDGRYEVFVKILRRGVSQLIYDMLKLIEELFNLLNMKNNWNNKKNCQIFYASSFDDLLLPI